MRVHVFEKFGGEHLVGPTMKVKSRTDYHDLNVNGFLRSSGSKRAESNSSRTDGRSIRAHADKAYSHVQSFSYPCWAVSPGL